MDTIYSQLNDKQPNMQTFSCSENQTNASKIFQTTDLTSKPKYHMFRKNALTPQTWVVL